MACCMVRPWLTARVRMRFLSAPVSLTKIGFISRFGNIVILGDYHDYLAYHDYHDYHMVIILIIKIITLENQINYL